MAEKVQKIYTCFEYDFFFCKLVSILCVMTLVARTINNIAFYGSEKHLMIYEYVMAKSVNRLQFWNVTMRCVELHKKCDKYAFLLLFKHSYYRISMEQQ